MMKQDAFYERPEREQCQAQLPGCTGGREVRLHCEVEGSDMVVCYCCHARWRRNATSMQRCPRCDNLPLNPARVAPASERKEFTLTGPAWLAINKAMHAEGLLIDQRMRIMERLAHEAPWLEDAAPVSHEIQVRLRDPEEAAAMIRAEYQKRGLPADMAELMIAEMRKLCRPARPQQRPTSRSA